MRALIVFPLVAAIRFAGDNVMTRVVKMLEEFGNTCRRDMEKEKELYDDFACWCKKVKTTKGGNIQAAEARIASIEGMLGQIEETKLTDEEAEYKKEQEQLEGEIQLLLTQNDTDRKKFEADHLEMTQTIEALAEALQILETHASSYPALISKALKSLPSRLTNELSLVRGMLVGLEREEPVTPEKDWKKLNREAVPFEQYSTRAGNVIAAMRKMELTASRSREEMESNEVDRLANVLAIFQKKDDRLNKVKQILLDSNAENAAKEELRTSLTEEKTALEEAKTADQGFIDQARSTCADKAAEFEQRKLDRERELAGIQQAISILRSDDARDVFKKSFASNSFVEVSSVRVKKMLKKIDSEYQVERVLDVLRTSGSAHLSALAIRLGGSLVGKVRQNPASIQAVIDAIDRYSNATESAQTRDDEQMEECTTQRTNLSSEAQASARILDNAHATIETAEANIVEFTQNIQSEETEISEMRGEIADLVGKREKENAEFLESKMDDQAAVTLIQRAIQALRRFYSAPTTPPPAGFLQASPFASGRDDVLEGSYSNADIVSSPETYDRNKTYALKPEALEKIGHTNDEYNYINAGLAPTPPPSTFEGSYEGHQGRNSGVIGLLRNVLQDVKKDIADAEAAEAQAASDHNKTVTDIRNVIANREEQISLWQDGIQTNLNDQDAARTDRGAANSTLAASQSGLAGIQGGCDWLAVHYATRKKNREIERAGLAKAKVMLNDFLAGSTTGLDVAEGAQHATAEELGLNKANRVPLAPTPASPPPAEGEA